MHLRTFLMLLQCYIYAATSWNYAKQQHLDLINFAHWAFHTQLSFTVDCFNNSDLIHSYRVALRCPLLLASPCARESYRAELWGPRAMKPMTLSCCHVLSSGTTLKWAPLSHNLPVRRLTRQWHDSLHLIIHQSCTYVMGVGWDKLCYAWEKRILERCVNTNWACKSRHRLRS